jgi:hypothetical protein
MAAGGAVLVIALLQLVGVLENPVARRVRENIESRGEESVRAAEPPPAPAIPKDLPSEHAVALRALLEQVRRPEAGIADAAMRELPERVAQVPEDRRVEVATVALASLRPAVASDGPRRTVALEAAARVLALGLPLAPETAREFHERAARVLQTSQDAGLLSAAVAVQATAHGPERPAAAVLLRGVAIDPARPIEVRVAAASALTSGEVDDALRQAAAAPDADPRLAEALRGK